MKMDSTQPMGRRKRLMLQRNGRGKESSKYLLAFVAENITDYRIYVRKKDSRKIMVSSPNQIEKMKKLTKEFFLLHGERERHFNKQK